MKLFYATGACSLASHIVMEEVGGNYEYELVDTKNKTYAGGDYKKISEKGAVPAFQMNNGEILTEGAVIMQYIADTKGDSTILGKVGTTERYRALEMTNYVASEVHALYGQLFHADRFATGAALETMKEAFRTELARRFDYIDAKLAKSEFVAGKTFTIADAYLFTCWNWNQYVGMESAKWKNINAWSTRVYARPAVQRAMKAEGLLK